MRTVLVTLCSVGAAFAAIDRPAGTSWGPQARASAMGAGYWTDSANWNLFDAAGHSAVLPGEFVRPFELRFGSRGLAASNSDVELSQNQAAAVQIRGGVEAKAGYRLDLDWTSQSFAVDGLPTYEAGRMRWGFDVGTAFGQDRLVGIGLGLRGRLPSKQTQDTSGAYNAPGDLERWQGGLEALRIGMAFHIAQAVTLAGKLEASLDVDTLVHTTPLVGLRSYHRFAVARFPILSFSAQVKKPEWPVEALGDVTFGTVHRMGVMKTTGHATELYNGIFVDGANVDFPKLVGDSLRILAAFQGRWGRDGHLVRPILAFEMASMRTLAYEPVPGSNDPFAGNAALLDTGWTRDRQSATLGAVWTWDRGVTGVLELGSSKVNLELDKGLDPDNELDESHTDMGMNLGFQLSHRLVPAWKEKVPAGQEYFFRLGWERWSLSGMGLEPGFLGGLTMGYEEPATGYQKQDGTIGNRFGWQGQEQAVGLAPTLGGGSDLNRFTFGLGASFLDGGLGLDLAMNTGTWTPDDSDADALDVFGWRAELRWSP